MGGALDATPGLVVVVVVVHVAATARAASAPRVVVGVVLEHVDLLVLVRNYLLFPVDEESRMYTQHERAEHTSHAE